MLLRIIIVAALLAISPALASDSSTTPVPADAAVSSEPASADATLADKLANPDAPVADADVADAATGVLAAVSGLDDVDGIAGIFSIIVASLWGILAALRRYEWMSPRWTRLVTLVVAPAAFFLAAYPTSGLAAALVYALGGPGALLLNEFGRLFDAKRKA